MSTRARIYPGDGDPRHGTYNGYRNLLCWCEDCRAANRERHRRERANRPPLAPDDPRHGTSNGYRNWNCRCHPCTTADSAQHKRRTDYLRAKRNTDLMADSDPMTPAQ